ncbi:hypothetical protein RUM43_011317 [Polyplax serrata]|uniref:Major facilitator superfamily (MFS) profile domain-containing protein n=1 Tax=Polyplax serrata TaxID=468196 RepID=A0AAN8NSV2_POLSC
MDLEEYKKFNLPPTSIILNGLMSVFFVSGLDFTEGIGSDFEHAVTHTGFGKFHRTLLFICGLIYANTALGITILCFVLPSAQCDFQMTSQDKGLLTAAPMLGMVIGSYFWGCLADTRGRKVVLVATLLMDGICGLASSISQYFTVFLVLRFFSGFALTGTMGIVFPYLGEFQSTKYREKLLCWMELFWTVGIIALPGTPVLAQGYHPHPLLLMSTVIAWLVIPLDINYETEYFVFRSWNLFVALCSLPSIFLGVWLCIFPESPKYLIEGEMFDEALNVFREMYSLNTGNPPDEYPVKYLKEKVRNMSIASVQSVTSVKSIKTIKTRRDFKILFNEIWWQTKALCKPPHLKYTVLTCLIQFGLTTSYYTLMIWFPELFYRFEEFDMAHPNQTASVCEVSSVFVNATTGVEEQFCGDPLDDSVFLHTLIIGLACIPTSVWLPLGVHRLGAKFFLVFSLLVSGAVTMGLYFVQTATQNLILSCIFEAFTSMGISTVYCMVVDLFPTNLRVMAAALSLTFGRGGALLGNLIFGFLIDMNCIVPIALFSAMLFLSGVLGLTLPSTGVSDLE